MVRAVLDAVGTVCPSPSHLHWLPRQLPRGREGSPEEAEDWVICAGGSPPCLPPPRPGKKKKKREAPTIHSANGILLGIGLRVQGQSPSLGIFQRGCCSRSSSPWLPCAPDLYPLPLFQLLRSSRPANSYEAQGWARPWLGTGLERWWQLQHQRQGVVRGLLTPEPHGREHCSP